MTDAAFHEFFLAAAGVAGALIGLLFVAISVTPAAASGKPGHLHQQVRAAAAMSMFLDALVVSLLALIPGGRYLGNGSTALAIVGLTSTAALVITVARTPDPSRTAWQSTRTIMLFAAVIVVYGLQLASALRMNAATANTGQVTNQATLVIIMFLMGVTRAWEIVGAAKPRVLGVLAHELGPPTQPVPRKSEAAVDSQPGATPIVAPGSEMAASLHDLWTKVGGEPALVVAAASLALVEPAPAGPALGVAGGAQLGGLLGPQRSDDQGVEQAADLRRGQRDRPAAPGPALIRCQAPAGTTAAIRSARSRLLPPGKAGMQWSQQTART